MGYYWVPGSLGSASEGWVCGLQDTGDLWAAFIPGTAAIGARTLVSMAALIMASATGGFGFIGGGWSGGVFRYNTAVVNVNTTVVRNVYVDRTVINNTTVIKIVPVSMGQAEFWRSQPRKSVPSNTSSTFSPRVIRWRICKMRRKTATNLRRLIMDGPP